MTWCGNTRCAARQVRGFYGTRPTCERAWNTWNVCGAEVLRRWLRVRPLVPARSTSSACGVGQSDE